MNTSPADDRPAAERRQSYRFRPGSLRSGRLLVGGREIPVEIVDESVGGFCVLVQAPEAFELGTTFLLDADCGCAEVQIRNLSLQELSQTIDGVTTSTTATRLGLERIRDVPPWETASPSRWELAWLEFKLAVSLVRPMARLIAGATALLGLALLLAVVLFWTVERPSESYSLRRGASSEPGRPEAPGRPITLHVAPAPVKPQPGATASAVPVELSLPRIHVPSTAPASNPQTRPDSSTRSLSDSAEPLLEVRVKSADAWEGNRALSPGLRDLSPESLPVAVVRRSLPAVLLQPEIARTLALHPEQKDQLLHLAGQQEVEGKEEEPDRPREESAGPSEAESELARRVLAILSMDQRRRLIRVLSEKEGDGPRAPQVQPPLPDDPQTSPPEAP